MPAFNALSVSCNVVKNEQHVGMKVKQWSWVSYWEMKRCSAGDVASCETAEGWCCGAARWWRPWPTSAWRLPLFAGWQTSCRRVPLWPDWSPGLEPWRGTRLSGDTRLCGETYERGGKLAATLLSADIFARRSCRALHLLHSSTRDSRSSLLGFFCRSYAWYKICWDAGPHLKRLRLIFLLEGSLLMSSPGWAEGLYSGKKYMGSWLALSAIVPPDPCAAWLNSAKWDEQPSVQRTGGQKIKSISIW